LNVVYEANLNGETKRACEIIQFDASGRQITGEVTRGNRVRPAPAQTWYEETKDLGSITAPERIARLTQDSCRTRALAKRGEALLYCTNG